MRLIEAGVFVVSAVRRVVVEGVPVVQDIAKAKVAVRVVVVVI